ncbi:hypothetical protein EXN66_Car012128 [Channa argus]|uniref:Uncharacterized protein n=1 Tax=Channa argus TaxID=215402 RepID=A0A6G1Q1H0_CHAAH|nr:hypothetical protein EXN66_Car012128 [Channa argus]
MICEYSSTTAHSKHSELGSFISEPPWTHEMKSLFFIHCNICDAQIKLFFL